MELIFKEFLGGPEVEEEEDDDAADDWSSSGDVKYHLGTQSSRKYPDGRTVNLSLLANPSHLEAVNPLVMGKCRAKMHYKGDQTGKSVVPVLLHGDAAFAGQGVVYESMQMTRLEGYSTGGTIHIVTNNQVGFTADPWQSRSTVYASDLGKTFDAPIFHVNADDAEAVVRVFALAARYRQKYGNDVVVDLIGYRKNGHNEIDEPSFTQPLMYETIKKHPCVLVVVVVVVVLFFFKVAVVYFFSCPPRLILISSFSCISSLFFLLCFFPLVSRSSLSIYREKLSTTGTLSQAEIDETAAFVNGCFDDAFAAAPDFIVPEDNWQDSNWKDVKSPNEHSLVRTTGVEIDALRKVSKVLATVPEDFNIHRRLNNMILKAKQKTLDEETGIDWGTAEALAFGTMLNEGTHVRVSGQDAQRGTFSHRHAVWKDQKVSGKSHTPLNAMGEGQALFSCENSPLSEFGVMGFELGYSQESPNALVIWEAQFGDFVNGAQIIIDQFISSGEAKWMNQSGLTLLLPHQYQGQGPEHSSARVERFLQSCDEDPDEVPDLNESTTRQIQNHNWQIVNCTTPANYFHVLRRQNHRDFRKPLVVIAPKGLLRLNDCTSSFEDMAEGAFAAVAVSVLRLYFFSSSFLSRVDIFFIFILFSFFPTLFPVCKAHNLSA
jgi:2-oxoglutarate dehydrogenase E1 component